MLSLNPSGLRTGHPLRVSLNGVGEGFCTDAQSISLEAGAVNGFAILGGHQRHDLALASIAYGHMLGPVRGEDHWYRGNWEWRGG